MVRCVQPEDVTKARRDAQIDLLYGRMAFRSADSQLVIPNYVARFKTADRVLRPVIGRSCPASAVPPASPLCKM